MDPSEDPTSIGNVLLSLGWITEDQLAKALEIRDGGEDRLLGQILLDNRHLTRDQMRQALRQQRKMRGAPKTGNDAHRAVCEARESTIRVNANIDGLTDLLGDMTKGKCK